MAVYLERKLLFVYVNFDWFLKDFPHINPPPSLFHDKRKETELLRSLEINVFNFSLPVATNLLGTNRS